MGGDRILWRATPGHGSARLTLRGGPPERSGVLGLLLRLLLGAGACLLVGSSLLMVGYVERTYGSHYSAVPVRPSRVVVVDLAANRNARVPSTQC